MKISGIKTYIVQPPAAKTVLFVKLETDSGLHGWGEVYTVTAREPALERLTLDLGEYLIGRDPLRVLGRADALKLITTESLHKAFVRFFPSNRYTVATLMPEAPAAASTARPTHP